MDNLGFMEDSRPIFTKEMKKDYVILAPQMRKIHFEFFEKILRSEGYHLEILKTTHQKIIEEGLKNIHNDTCYPALLVIGQLIDALKSGLYDINKTALMITQTGGGCRASNYIHLLRKALIKAGFAQVPVISLNFSRLEKNSGFSLSLGLIKKLNSAIILGDLLMWVANHKRAYEKEKGITDKILEREINNCKTKITAKKAIKKRALKKLIKEIIIAFDNIEVSGEIKPKVGIVGEIYVKFAPLGNNQLEEFLISEGVEVVVPGFYDFAIFQLDVKLIDAKLYGGKSIFTKIFYTLLLHIMIKWQKRTVSALKKSKTLPVYSGYKYIRKAASEYIGLGNKMGEGWLLIAEIAELLHLGVNNIICTQPFGCLPNHIVGKGMIKKIKEKNPEANIVPIDYDPGASRVNQENRIRLMLSTASKNLERKNKS